MNPCLQTCVAKAFPFHLISHADAAAWHVVDQPVEVALGVGDAVEALGVHEDHGVERGGVAVPGEGGGIQQLEKEQPYGSLTVLEHIGLATLIGQ